MKDTIKSVIALVVLISISIWLVWQYAGIAG